MSDTAIQNLRAAVAGAAGAAVALDAAFLAAGLADATVRVPAAYDAHVAAAFQVASAAAFLATYDAANVGAVVGDRFAVTAATVPFPGGPQAGTATLLFVVTGAGDARTLVVQVAVAPASWTWTTSFPYMAGWPFDQLVVSGAWFVFSTADGVYPWGTGAAAVTGGPGQNLSAQLPLPAVVTAVLPLFAGLGVPSSVPLAGFLDLSEYDGETVLLPTGTLLGPLAPGNFTLAGYLSVAAPAVSVDLPAPVPVAVVPEGFEALFEGDAEPTDQAASLSVSAGLAFGAVPGSASPYLLRVSLSDPANAAAAAAAPEYSIGMVATGEGPPLSPATVVQLIGGGASYFGGTPPILQQYLAAVGLQGLSLSGTVAAPPTVDAVAVRIGSSPNTSFRPIPDPTGALNFEITSFSLNWQLLNPFIKESRQQSFQFGTTFTLAPQVFKGPGGVGNGVFTVEFTSGLQFFAAFDGTASLRDFVSTLSGGALSLPAGIDASMSDVRLSVDYNAQSFTFAAGYEASVSFLTVGGQPILQVTDGQVSLGAQTPTQARGGAVTATAGTVWQGSIAGLLAVGPLAANVRLAYDGVSRPATWSLDAALAQPIQVQEVIKQFFNAGGVYGFPSFLPGELLIKTFAISAAIPARTGAGAGATTYEVDTTFSWLFTFGQQKVGIEPAHIALAYDGSKAQGKQFSGLAEGTWRYDAINLKLLFGYQFVQGGNRTLYVDWEGFRATYESGAQTVTFSLKGWSLGTLIQALVRTLGDPYFTLSSPWNLLDQVSLDGLSVSVSLANGVQNRLTASYTLSSPLNLGFATIKRLTFRRDTTGKVTLALDADISPVLIGSLPADAQKKLRNLTDPATGQDVKNLPAIPGRGQSYFKVFLLVLGQRVGITGYRSFNSTREAICALRKVPSTTGGSNPVNPGADGGSPPNGVPYYDPNSNWLIAAHLGLLQVAGAWTVDAMVVFNDPNLYGLRLALAGPRAGGLAGLAIDVLYKKITDDVGVFQIDFTFPDSIRNLNFGAVNVTLPQIGIKVYTNGDFFVDIGFPYNLDFSRSFSISAIVYGVPVLGSGGLYFGKLSAATATQVPKTTKGTFQPVVVFGLGLQLGLGYNFTKGPLSAGFALTVFGIVEGVIAAWHPYDGSTMVAERAAASGLQSDYYFKISGTVGVIGLLYGKLDFAIIQASLSVKITLSLQVTYESYRAIPLIATATVDVSLKVKIDLGLFSFTISLSFSARVSAEFRIGSDQVAPWDDLPSVSSLRAMALTAGAARLARGAPVPRPKRVAAAASGAAAPPLTVVVSPQFTVLEPGGGTNPAAQQGAFVLLLAMDAPDATRKGGGDSSFDRLCAAYFPWLIDALSGTEGDTVDLAQAARTVVSRAELEYYVHRLADTAHPPLGVGDLLGFMKSAFVLDVQTPHYAQTSGVQPRLMAGATLFPVFDGLSLTVPAASGTGTVAVDFAGYTTTTQAYRDRVAALFAQVEAAIEQTGGPPAAPRAAEATPAPDQESMAAVVFVDTFAIIGRQLLQTALDSLAAYAHAFGASDSIASVITWAGEDNALTPADVAVPNQDLPLAPALSLSVPGLYDTLQAGDRLDTVARRYSDSASPARWTTTPEALINANGTGRILNGGVPFTIQGKNGPFAYVTAPGDSFENIAAQAEISLPALASQTVLYTVDRLLAPATRITIPPLAYRTAGTAGSNVASPDTLGSVAAFFAATVLALAAANTGVAGLFFAPAGGTVLITVANLASLPVADLWSGVQATDEVSTAAGMVSRFLMFGLRLPAGEGLTPSARFLYPAGLPEYGLYQLVGQQFPTPAALAGGYAVTLSRAAQSHGVDLSWVQFDGVAGSTAATADLTAAWNRLAVVLRWAQGGNFKPSPTFQPLPLSTREPQSLAVQNFALWSTSDMTRLLALTDRGRGSGGGEGGQAQPVLWPVPASLLNLAAARQQAAQALFPRDVQKLDALLPRFRPQVGSTPPSGGQTAYAGLQRWAWATRVDFQVKRLPASQVAARSGTGAGAEPAGPASAAYLPNVYEVVGPSSEQALLLERLLTAMHLRGEDVVSGLFLLSSPGGSDTPQLVTLGDAEFLAFLTQTNLSTESNPAARAMALLAGAPAPPRGIANPAAEFIKLLWELSVVRSGGYYLYYEVADGGAGLPASIFDTSGTGTLTMVALTAAQGPASPGETLTDFVNAFVTTGAVDTSREVVRLHAVEAQGRSAPLAGTLAETLDALARTYGVGVGQLAEANPAAPPLASGRVIPVTGVVRQLWPADVRATPQDTLDALAAYYSVGAQTPVTGAQIAALNPGVQPAAGAVLAIPGVHYVVAPAAAPGTAPGNTFGSIAAYYGLSPDQVAIAARAVQAPFAAGTVLNVPTTRYDLRSTLGSGNLHLQLQRDNPGQPELPANPTPEQQAAYALAYMDALYNTLSAGLQASAWFRASPWGLPFGPQQHDDGTQDAPQAYASRADATATRQARLAAGVDADYVYRQALGFGAFSRVNPAPSLPGMPAPSANPYVGVGTWAQVALRWQDLFGNTTVTPFESIPARYTGALNGSAVPLRYGDRLLGIGGWPNTRASYTYTGTAGAPVLAAQLVLDTQRYQGDAGQAGRDLALYTLVYFQLHQDYTGLNVPGVTGNAVAMRLSSSLLAAPDAPLADGDAEKVRAYVRQCVAWLTAASAGGTLPGTPVQTLLVPVDVGGVAAGNVIELDVALVFQRQAALVDPAVAGLADGISVSSVVLPHPDGAGAEGAAVAYREFAAAFERVFQTSAWEMKVGEGLREDDGGGGTGAQQLWAVRMGKAAGQGITFTLGTSPSYYAPEPVATSLASQTVAVTDYDTGEVMQTSFTGVDQNLWFQTVLDAVDSFLSARYSSSAFILDKLGGKHDPLDDGFLGQVLNAKQTLADAIAATVRPVLSTSAVDPSTAYFAGEKLRQQLLNQLGAAYAGGTVVVFGVTDVSGGSTSASGPPGLYGQPTGGLAGGAGNQNFSLTAARVPLGATPAPAGGGTYDPRLAFVFTTRNAQGAQAYAPLELALALTHLEFDRTAVPGIGGYVQSRWLAFVNGPFSYPLAGGGTLNVPVVNRALPTPPTVQRQAAAQPTTTPAVPSDLARWTYSYQYVYPGAAGDAVQATIELNQLPDGVAASNGGRSDLFRALAQFVTAYPSISRDLNAALLRVDGQTPDPVVVETATKAVTAFATYVTAVARAYAAPADFAATLAAMVAPQRIELAFAVALSEARDGSARTDLLAVSINGRAATYDAATGTLGNGTTTVPAVVVQILPEVWTAGVVPSPENVVLSYRYTRQQDGGTQVLAYADAELVQGRTVVMAGLDALAHQSAWSSLFVQRNLLLFPVEDAGRVHTTSDFIFQTPQVKFADAVVPRLVHPAYPLGTLALGTEGALKGLLDTFFQGLFTGADTSTTVEVQLEGSYSYQMVPLMPRQVLPVSLLPPTETPVSSTTPPAFTQGVADTIDRWMAEYEPTTSGAAQVDFRMTVFGASGARQPLVTVGDLAASVIPG